MVRAGRGGNNADIALVYEILLKNQLKKSEFITRQTAINRSR